MRANWMHFAAIVTLLSLLAGCVPVPPMQQSPTQPSPEARPLATQPPAAQAPPTEAAPTQPPPAQLPITAPSATPSTAAPDAGLLALVQAFEEAYNRHDVDAAAGLFADDGCIDWGDGGRCGYWANQLLRYDAALHRELELSDCSVAEGRVTCKGVQRDDCLAAGGLGGTHFAPVVFLFEDGKITLVRAIRTPKDTQRDLLFLYKLAGWAHRTRPAEWDKVERGDLLDNANSWAPFVDRTGAAMSTLCKEYAAYATAATPPTPAPLPGQVPPATAAPGRVLFIGDSFSWGLNNMFPKLAASGQPSVTVASKLDWYPSATLGVDYELGTALDDIRQGKWDVVVLEDDLQAGWPAREAEFYEYGRKFDQAIKQASAETVFFMVQPYKDGSETTAEEIAAAYTKIGQELGDKVAPVGLAFRRALRERPDLVLYAADKEHPSPAGIYLEACVLYATITGRSPVGFTYRMQGEPSQDWRKSEAGKFTLARFLDMDVPGANWEIPERDAADLQRIAWETVQDYQAQTPQPSGAPAPAAGRLALVKAFEEAYNRHDVDAAAGLFADDGCIDWGVRSACGYWSKQLLLYDAALNREFELSDCSVEDGRVTCKAAQRDVCLEAGGLGETHFAPVVFMFEDGKILLVQATKTPEDAQRDLLFLYKLAGWAHRTRPAEWEKAGRGDLLDNRWYAPPFVDRTGAAMSALCKEYAAAATTPTPAPAPPIPPASSVPGSVLFIGDKLSLRLDGLFPKLAASGQPSVTVASKLNWYPSAALGAHYELGTALDDIRQGKWDVVVLEDDLQADWPARAGEFAEYGRRFDEAIKQTGAETVFIMVQPYEDENEATTEEIAAAYGKIGQDLGDKVAPVGLAFRRALRERPDLNLYAADRWQASWAGIYLTGCVLYATITGRSPVGLTYRMQGETLHDWQLSDAERSTFAVLGYNVPDWEISEKDAADLQRIAWETVQDHQAGR